MDKGICKGCGAEIRWVEMTSGKRMPVNVPGKKGVWLQADGLGIVTTFYEPHWATCWKSDEFKGKGDEANKV